MEHADLGPRVQRFDVLTEDPGEIHELTRRMYGTGMRVERRDGRPPSLRLAHAAVDEFGAQRVTWNVDGRCDVDPLGRFLCIRLHRGTFGLDQGDGLIFYTPGDTFVVDPGRGIDAMAIGADLDSLTIETAVLHEVAAQLAPRSQGRLDYRRTVPRDPRLRRAWSTVLDEVERALGDGDLLAENALLRAGFLYRLAATACAAFGLLPDEDATERSGTPRTVARAIAYLEEHLAEPITVGDIAMASGLSVRGLQDTFQRTLGVSPTAYLRRARLAAARADLTDATDATTVSAVAHRWGFAHLSRFAAAYRKEFGESPSATLWS